LHRCRFHYAIALTWISRAAASILFLWKYGKELDIFHSVFSRLKHQFVMERIKELQRGLSEAWNRLSTPYNQHTDGMPRRKPWNEGEWTYMIDITFWLIESKSKVYAVYWIEPFALQLIKSSKRLLELAKLYICKTWEFRQTHGHWSASLVWEDEDQIAITLLRRWTHLRWTARVWLCIRNTPLLVLISGKSSKRLLQHVKLYICKTWAFCQTHGHWSARLPGTGEWRPNCNHFAMTINSPKLNGVSPALYPRYSVACFSIREEVYLGSCTVSSIFTLNDWASSWALFTSSKWYTPLFMG
jgi:hypothetical protein